MSETNGDNKIDPGKNSVQYHLDKDLEDLLREIFGIRDEGDSKHELIQALSFYSCTSWKSFRRVDNESIKFLTKNADRVRVPIEKSIQMVLKVLIQYVRKRMSSDRDVALVNLMDHLLETATLFDGCDGSAAPTGTQKLSTLLHQLGYNGPMDV